MQVILTIETRETGAGAPSQPGNYAFVINGDLEQVLDEVRRILKQYKPSINRYVLCREDEPKGITTIDL